VGPFYIEIEHMRTIIVNIGHELLNGSRRNTNADYLIESLSPYGAEVICVEVVRDDETDMARCLAAALPRCQLLLITGGLGPTADDLTRQVLTKVLGLKMAINEGVERQIRARFEQRGVEMPAINLKQAMVPQGAIVIENERGTAPGLVLRHEDTFIVALPGPPKELGPMVLGAVRALLKEQATGEPGRAAMTLHTSGQAESVLCEKIEDIFVGDTNPALSVTAHRQGVDLRISGVDQDDIPALTRVSNAVEMIRSRLGDCVYGQDEESLESVVAQQLTSLKMTVSVAESCTAGLLGFRLSAVPGSSNYFRGGIIAYDNKIKESQLSVPAELIAEQGAVCPEVAESMARGVLRLFDTTLGIGITGIAGPGGATKDKRVGTVCICVQERDGKQGSGEFNFGGDREDVRWRSCQMALDMIRRLLLKRGVR
jgi:nicotinamide-nucleotide amidase